MRRASWGIVVALALSACQGDGGKDLDDSALREAGVLAAPLEERAVVSVSIVGSAEPLATSQVAPPLGSEGRWALALEFRNTGPGPLHEVAAALVDASGDEGLAPEVVRVEDLAPGERRVARVVWTVRDSSEAMAVAVAFGRGEDRRRAILPFERPRPGVVLETVGVAGEAALPERSRRFLGREEADHLGYDVLVATGEKMVIEAVLASTPARAAVSARLALRPAGAPGPRVEVRGDVVEAGGRRRISLLVDTEAAAVGKSEYDLVAQYLAGGEVVERRWRLRLGVHDLDVLEDGDRFRFAYRLPSGASGEWEGPARLADRDAPGGLEEALRDLRARTAGDLTAAFRSTRLRYDPPATGAVPESALRSELARALGRAAGYALLRTQVKTDLERGLPGQPALARELTRKAGDLGLVAGPELLDGALADWRPAAGAVSLETATEPEPPATAVPSPAELVPLVATAEIRLASARFGGGDARPVAPGETIRADAMPLALAYDVSGIPDAGEAGYELVLLSGEDVSVSVEARSDGRTLEVYVERLEPGTWRAGLLARWEGGRTLSGPALSIEVAGPPAGEDFPDDLLGLLSPKERERVAEGKSFQKTVAVQREGRFKLSKRQFAIEMGQVIDKGDVSIQLVSAVFDEATGNTRVEFRLTSKRTKTWNLSVAPVGAGPPGAAPPPSRELAIPMKEGEPEIVSFSIPGRLGETFTLLEHSISGSPTTLAGALGVTHSQFSSLAAMTASLSEILKASIQNSPTEWREIRLADFEAMGGQLRFLGTGGPHIGIEIVQLPGGLETGVNIVLLIPAGTRVAGGGDIQELVIPADIRINLSAAAPGTLPPPVIATAYCVEQEKPFPTGQKELAGTEGDLTGESSRYAHEAMQLLTKGGYEGLDVLTPGELTELGQVLVWAFLELGPNETVSPELADKFARAFRVAVGQLPQFARFSPLKRRKIAESLNQVFLDALFLTRPR